MSDRVPPPPGWGFYTGQSVALLLIVFGLVVPALDVNAFWFIRSETSIWDGIVAFYEDEQYFLALLIFGVSVALPLLKILTSLFVIRFFADGGGPRLGLLRLLSMLSKWSMADVFVLAFIVLLIDARLVSTADLLPGAYLFASGVLLTTLVSQWLEIRTRKIVGAAL